MKKHLFTILAVSALFCTFLQNYASAKQTVKPAFKVNQEIIKKGETPFLLFFGF